MLTLGGWTSARIAEAFGVREDTVRLWRSDFMSGGVDALKASVAPGPAPVKAAAALKVAEPLLSAPVANRTNWTLARLSRPAWLLIVEDFDQAAKLLTHNLEDTNA